MNVGRRPGIRAGPGFRGIWQARPVPVDSYAYLPRSFRALYENPPRLEGEDGAVWAPFEVRLADAYLVMSSIVLAVLQPEAGARWNAALTELHRASQQSVPKTREAAQQLRDIASSALPAIGRQTLSKAQAVELLDRVARAGIDGKAGDFTAAKQIYYALSLIHI